MREDARWVGRARVGAQGGSRALPTPGAGSRVRVTRPLAPVGLLVAWRRSEKCVKAAGLSWPGGVWCSRTLSGEGLRGRWAGALVLLLALGAVRLRTGGPWDIVGK